MEQYFTFGTITLNVSTKVLAGSQQEALQKIYQLINELNANIINIPIMTINGEIHNLDVNNFHIEWEEALK